LVTEKKFITMNGNMNVKCQNMLEYKLYIAVIYTRTFGFRRIRMNYELNDLIKNAYIVRFVKIKTMVWLGHVMRMEGKRIP